jgi:hypothetical protein
MYWQLADKQSLKLTVDDYRYIPVYRYCTGTVLTGVLVIEPCYLSVTNGKQSVWLWCMVHETLVSLHSDCAYIIHSRIKYRYSLSSLAVLSD